MPIIALTPIAGQIYFAGTAPVKAVRARNVPNAAMARRDKMRLKIR